MICDHPRTRMAPGRAAPDGSRYQRCRSCGMQRVLAVTGDYGDWHNRPCQRTPTTVSDPAPPSVPVTPLELVFSAEILALARQLMEARLAVEVLAMRMNRAVESYNAEQPISRWKVAAP